MTYYKLRNDMSIATLSRIVAAAYDLGKGSFICDIQVFNVLDVRLRILPPRDKEAYEQLAADIGHQCGSLPFNALKIVEEEV